MFLSFFDPEMGLVITTFYFDFPTLLQALPDELVLMGYGGRGESALTVVVK